MKIQIIKNSPIDEQDSIQQYIGKIYEPVKLKKYYDKEVVKEMKELGEIAVFLEQDHKSLSILNKDEYIVIEG